MEKGEREENKLLRRISGHKGFRKLRNEDLHKLYFFIRYY
jgi:hypothetical protein